MYHSKDITLKFQGTYYVTTLVRDERIVQYKF